MPVYEWKCSLCKYIGSVVRSMDDCMVPPLEVHCLSSEWSRVYSIPQVNIKSPSTGGWQPWKYRPGAVDEAGNRVEIEFKTRQQQEEWMGDNDLVYSEELRDPSIGDSQHSVLDQKWAPPPSIKDPDAYLKAFKEQVAFPDVDEAEEEFGVEVRSDEERLAIAHEKELAHV